MIQYWEDQLSSSERLCDSLLRSRQSATFWANLALHEEYEIVHVLEESEAWLVPFSRVQSQNIHCIFIVPLETNPHRSNRLLLARSFHTQVNQMQYGKEITLALKWWAFTYSVYPSVLQLKLRCLVAWGLAIYHLVFEIWEVYQTNHDRLQDPVS